MSNEAKKALSDLWNAIPEDCMPNAADEWYQQISAALQEREYLKNALRDVLKAIVSDRQAVCDTIWVNGTPVGDFIACAIDDPDMDFDELQNAPYRCKQTAELPLMKDWQRAVVELSRAINLHFFNDRERIVRKHAATIEAAREALKE